DSEIKDRLGFVTFTSRTVRAFKLNDLEDTCEDYGQVAYYDGSLPGHTYFFDLDNHHRFFTGKPMLVCGNTASMLSGTRYSKAFKVIGGREVHHGVFSGCSNSFSDETQKSGSCC
ncbi:MAG: hypothetical protein LBH03_01100, partial [Holophagales bacterium]|nr:hypothetical protein [Holophagales bacterium]